MSFTVTFVCTYITVILFRKIKLAQATLGQTLTLERLEMLNTKQQRKYHGFRQFEKDRRAHVQDPRKSATGT